MARKTEKEVKDEVKKVSKTTTKKATTKKKDTVKKDVEKKEKKTTTAAKKTTTKKAAKTVASKEKAATTKAKAKSTTTKKASTSSKKATTTKKATTKSKTATTKKTTTTRKRTVKATPISTAKQMLAEYYDLPYAYNETTVKILAQTPTTLFVYWDISQDDRNRLMSQYGENFFYDSRPILIIHNKTKNYSFEIEINDFANSWYIRCQEPNCDYSIELGRKLVQRPDEYIYIDSSNEIISPNDHILFESADLGHVRFRNIKTGILSEKDYGSLRFINNIDKLYIVHYIKMILLNLQTQLLVSS